MLGLLRQYVSGGVGDRIRTVRPGSGRVDGQNRGVRFSMNARAPSANSGEEKLSS